MCVEQETGSWLRHDGLVLHKPEVLLDWRGFLKCRIFQKQIGIDSRLKGIVQEINETLNVDGLCRAFKQRVHKLVDRDGDRITN